MANGTHIAHPAGLKITLIPSANLLDFPVFNIGNMFIQMR